MDNQKKISELVAGDTVCLYQYKKEPRFDKVTRVTGKTIFVGKAKFRRTDGVVQGSDPDFYGLPQIKVAVFNENSPTDCLANFNLNLALSLHKYFSKWENVRDMDPHILQKVARAALSGTATMAGTKVK